jgi:hypothetical protein
MAAIAENQRWGKTRGMNFSGVVGWRWACLDGIKKTPPQPVHSSSSGAYYQLAKHGLSLKIIDGDK